MSEVAIVTGASRGIGAATARLLAARGYRVCVNYRTEPESAERLCAEIEAAGGRAVAVAADVSDAAQVERLFATVDDELGPLTALVNNAAMLGPSTRVADLDPADMERLLEVNVMGVVHCTQQALRRMSTTHGGSGGAIVNVSSGASYVGEPGTAVHYAATKGAVTSFTIGLAQEVMGEGVRVNTVSPGPIRTAMPHPDALERGAQIVPARRAGEPEEVAEAIVWLLSPAASYVACANIRVAGGKP
jgi:NAD(P)-dependent dehydrogenase (short-subunit alcohol dehydrogenase family)